MLTLSVIKENPEEVIRRLAIKHFDGKEAINRVLELDKIRRAFSGRVGREVGRIESFGGSDRTTYESRQKRGSRSCENEDRNH